MSYLPEGYQTTKLYEGGVDDDMEGIFTRRVTFGLINPRATRAMRIRTEQKLITDGVYPISGVKRVTEITPVDIYLGRGLAFVEGKDSGPPVGTQTEHILEDLGLEVVQTVHLPDTACELSIPQLERLAGAAGLAAFTSLDQVRQTLGLGPI